MAQTSPRCAIRSVRSAMDRVRGGPVHDGGYRAPSPDHLLDPLIAPLVSDFTPDAFYTKWIDLGLLLLLSLLRTLMPQPTSVLAIVEKASVACAGILTVALHVAVVRPFPRRDSWKGWVRFFLLIDAAGCVAMNAAVTLQDYGLSSVYLDNAVRGGAFALFAACVLTLAVLLGGGSHSRCTWDWSMRQVQRLQPLQLQALRDLMSRGAYYSARRLSPVWSLRLLESVSGTASNQHAIIRIMQDTAAPCGARTAALSAQARPRRPASASASASTTAASKRVTEHTGALEQLLRDSVARGDSLSAADTAAFIDVVTRVGVALRSRRVDSDARAAAASVRPLVAALQLSTAHPGMRAAACDALSAALAIDNSGFDGSAVASALVEAGAASALLSALTHSSCTDSSRADEGAMSGNNEIQRIASDAIANLAHTAFGASSIIASGCLGPLVALLTLPCATFPENVAAACVPLAALAVYHDDSMHITALASAGTMEAVAGALTRLEAATGPPLCLAKAEQSSVAALAAVYPQDPSIRAAVEAAVALVTNATVNEGALARYLIAGGLAPLLALFAAHLLAAIHRLCAASQQPCAASGYRYGALRLSRQLGQETFCWMPSPLKPHCVSPRRTPWSPFAGHFREWLDHFSGRPQGVQT